MFENKKSYCICKQCSSCKRALSKIYFIALYRIFIFLDSLNIAFEF